MPGEEETLLCSSYTEARLAAVYDTLNPFPDRSTFFYLELAGAVPRRVLDIGCGTGRLACALAARGHRVTGADPAPAMLDIARRRPGGAAVAWVGSDAGGLSLAERFDLIVMTGHVFQVFLGDCELDRALRTLRAHLAPGGCLAFETRNPAAREWDAWTPAETAETLEVDGLGRVDVHYRVVEERGALVTFETHFRFAGDGAAVTRTTLRFIDRDSLAARLAAAGFAGPAWYGDWDRSPFAPAGLEIIVLAPAAATAGGSAAG